MNTNLLIFFAIPLAVIVISIALQKLLRSPGLVASIIFVIFLILAIVLDDLNILILAILYAILAYISAILSCLLCRILCSNPDLISCRNLCEGNRNNDTSNANTSINTDDINTLVLNDTNTSGNNNQINTINTNGLLNNSSNRCNCNNSNTFVAQARINPNSNTNGRTGSFNGCYRRV